MGFVEYLVGQGAKQGSEGAARDHCEASPSAFLSPYLPHPDLEDRLRLYSALCAFHTLVEPASTHGKSCLRLSVSKLVSWINPSNDGDL